MTAREQAIEAAAKAVYAYDGGEWDSASGALRDHCRGSAGAVAAVLVPVLLNDLADRIAKLAPYNCELRYDGSEDPHAAAWVEGIHDAHALVVRAAAEGWGQ